MGSQELEQGKDSLYFVVGSLAEVGIPSSVVEETQDLEQDILFVVQELLVVAGLVTDE